MAVRNGLFVCASIVFGLNTYGQTTIEGRVLSRDSGTPLAYATIFNTTSGKGAISDESGYFQIEISNAQDEVVVSFIGFQKERLELKPSKVNYEVLLSESVAMIGEIEIVGTREKDWFDLLDECRKRQSKNLKKSKVYFELHSTLDNSQIELVEGYYNAEMRGYDLLDLDMKAGRLAVQPSDNRLFVSLESSRAITMHQLFEKSVLFPESPLHLNRKQLKSNYSMSMSKRYINEASDTIMVLDYHAKQMTGRLFSGEIWINTSTKNILKIIQHCASAKRYPFRPLFPHDTIRNIDMSITKTFREQSSEAFFNHVDFSYTVDYQDRRGAQYRVRTQAALFAYAQDEVFELPEFAFSSDSIGDYRKINAYPYNDFFWTYHEEPKVSDLRQDNERYFQSPESITNMVLFTTGNLFEGGARLLQHPFVAWSEQRIHFREFEEGTVASKAHNNNAFNSDLYRLGVKIFMDANSFGDSTNILTATIFDPYESSYRLPQTPVALCFINVFFDLMEVERRDFMTDVSASKKSIPEIKQLYHQYQQHWSALSRRYFSEVQRGENLKNMESWNQRVLDNLGIDNMAFFGLKELKE
ncbi:MAG: carboxypeptidase-like regulatory domain-containing protein [Saprospiraceae bacterium]|nr:carboxypeptidase-like regulatory domain-containing protein [Saprospiraceae bacterium]